ncbi:hypothetical protein EV360DRAFT_80160 [Lentinula raphanica]|nr:hypothetical protein EV360DRAFT_80160 [Lentinula raphanica]
MSKHFRPLETLLVHLSCWRNVYLDFSDLPPNAQFAPYVPSENLLLEKFAMRTFKFHPRFASYELISTYMDWISSLAEYSSALRDFSSYGTGHISRLSGFNSFYSRSSSLISCDLTGLAHYPDWISDFQHAAPHLREDTVLPKLRTLSVTAEQDIDRFWGHLILLNLEKLEIWMLSSARQWHQGEELVQTLRRSGSVAVVDSDIVTPTSFLTHGSLTSTRGPPISRLADAVDDVSALPASINDVQQSCGSISPAVDRVQCGSDSADLTKAFGEFEDSEDALAAQTAKKEEVDMEGAGEAVFGLGAVDGDGKDDRKSRFTAQKG